jgi:NTE family protein
MSKTKIAIACQGGGSQTAFTAGALKTLSDAGLSDKFDIVGLSGTSGGALCAALVWYAAMKKEQKWGRLMEFWKDNTAQSWAEQFFNDTVINYIRMINSGMMPSLQVSPSDPLMHEMMSAATMGLRPAFCDFGTLLRKHIDFDEIASWGPCPNDPALILGAANVTTGALAKFASTRETIRIEHILASCAVPTIFGAVQIGEHAYWDGLFSDNPPVEELVRARSVGIQNIPEEIWLIKINPTSRARVPVHASDIIDRRNQLEGNISLFQQLSLLERLNDWIMYDAFRPEFLARFDIHAPIRIPKSFETDVAKPYHIPCIEMPIEMQDTLGYEGKIDRSASNINTLITAGEAAARLFFEKRAEAIASPPPVPPAPPWLQSLPAGH